MLINGNLVYKERVMLGLSLRDMEKYTGVSKSTLSRIENSNEINVHITTLGKIARALKRETGYFIICKLK